MSSTSIPNTLPGTNRFLNPGLWLAQILMAALFIPVGIMKLSTPIPELAKMLPFAAQYPEMFVRFVGLVDLLGGIGIILPALTRIWPRGGLWAAIGIIALQVLATAFHLMRGEAQSVPLNIILIALALFVLWGRSSKAPIAPRWQ
ncbi:MAG: hypothetical protein RL748_780 [Pseudomonadota bacterium]|jgi:uncharacterized membrane protein YphA (DoxX/SURF4 family)